MSGNNKFKVLGSLPKSILMFILFSGGIFITSCNQQARGFALPDGDIEEGKATYTRLACNECHRITGIEWKGGRDNLNIYLGGDVSRKKSYGELVTSVINPSHKIAWRYKQETSTVEGISNMKNYNEIMTVQELVDIVAFLQSEYKVVTPQTNYRPYEY